MADLEARREARRRKILENSANRLSRITGNVKNTDRIEVSDTASSASLRQHHLKQPVQSILANDDDDEDVLSNNVLTGLASNLRVSDTSNRVRKRSYKNINVLLSGLFQGVLFVILDFLRMDVTTSYLGYIFVPLMALEIIYYFLGEPLGSSKVVDMVLAFCNVKQIKFLVICMNLMNRFMDVMQDVALYFFGFVIVQSLSNFELFLTTK